MQSIVSHEVPPDIPKRELKFAWMQATCVSGKGDQTLVGFCSDLRDGDELLMVAFSIEGSLSCQQLDQAYSNRPNIWKQNWKYSIWEKE